MLDRIDQDPQFLGNVLFSDEATLIGTIRSPQVIFQQDGAPPHWNLDVWNSLKEFFPDRYIGHGGPFCWPPRSPDITPVDFFLWGYVKDRVFATPVQDLHDLRTRTLDTIATVPIDMLDRMWHEIEYRLDIVRATNGAHIEVF
ncbi:hypothetical protein L9F63_019201 [Diploptera punctata]|uniref:Transposable element Tc3 transposase n=1 Tax=Diploptera punctata TaxID=6984 RepID=A0AAD7ZUP7_DIPPU|nr:hypothetical protein L9F63_019201 [Diploptera punctata]